MKAKGITLSIVALLGVLFFLSYMIAAFQNLPHQAPTWKSSRKARRELAERARREDLERIAQQDEVDKREKRIVEQQMRYQVIIDEYLHKFIPPKVDDYIEVTLANGSVVKGTLESYDNNSDENGCMQIRISELEGSCLFRKRAISVESKIKYYTQDYAIYWTEKQMAEEFPDYKTPTDVWVVGGQHSDPPMYPVNQDEQ